MRSEIHIQKWPGHVQKISFEHFCLLGVVIALKMHAKTYQGLVAWPEK